MNQHLSIRLGAEFLRILTEIVTKLYCWVKISRNRFSLPDISFFFEPQRAQRAQRKRREKDKAEKSSQLMTDD